MPIRSYSFLSTDSEKNVRLICLIQYSVGGTFLLPHRSDWNRFLQNCRMFFAAVGRLHLSVATGLSARKMCIRDSSYISQDKEKVNLAYESHAMNGNC